MQAFNKHQALMRQTIPENLDTCQLYQHIIYIANMLESIMVKPKQTIYMPLLISLDGKVK